MTRIGAHWINFARVLYVRDPVQTYPLPDGTTYRGVPTLVLYFGDKETLWLEGDERVQALDVLAALAEQHSVTASRE